jgi:hypothetical protein
MQFRSSKAVGLSIVALFLSACGGGGSSPTAAPTTTTPASSGTGSSSGSTASAATKVTITVPLTQKAAAGASTSRKAQYVSPSTTFVFFDLQDSPGHGNPSFAYTEQLNSSNCTQQSGSQTCTFTVQEPPGFHTFSVATGGPTEGPLGYASIGVDISALGTNETPAIEIGPIVANVTASYAFAAPAGGGQPQPLVTVTFLDALGNAISPFVPDNPVGFWNGPVTVTQSAGTFSIPSVYGSGLPPASPVTTASLLVPYPYQITELGNGTTNVFSTTLTFSASNYVLTTAEFPQLTNSYWSVPYTNTTLQLTCQFTTSAPTTDPCPGTQPASFSIQ